jgi:hypothetical protein
MEMARAGDAAKPAIADSTGLPGPCGKLDAAPPEWPASQLERSLNPSAAQRAALDQLKSAIGDGVVAIKSACRDPAAPTPVERLQAMQNTLWAVRDAAILIRAPLARFLDALTDEQRQQFVVSIPQPEPPVAARGQRAAVQDELLRHCGMPNPAQSPLAQAEKSLQLGDAQRASLDKLQKKSIEMGRFLMASCLQPIPAAPAARLDIAVDRLTAVLFATSNIGLALNDFYNQLSDQQKAKFSSQGQ